MSNQLMTNFGIHILTENEYQNTIKKENDLYLISDGKIPPTNLAMNDIFNLIYPIGSIYMSVNNINPSKLFGGVWEEWGEGKTIIGVDLADTDFNAAEKTGGEKTHTLSVEEIPSHTHSQGYYSSDWTDEVPDTSAYAAAWGGVRGSGVRFRSNNESATGGDQAHNNLQPYITCYIWKRTS